LIGATREAERPENGGFTEWPGDDCSSGAGMIYRRHPKTPEEGSLLKAVPLVVLFLSATMLPASANMQAACTEDALRLCNAYIPNEARVKSCLARNKAKLSPACKPAFGGKR
jgi:hypothetical protein